MAQTKLKQRQLDITFREYLTADRTYYVRTDGSDSNDGLANTSGGAFLTIQKAINVVASIDLVTYNVTIQVADGTYTQALVINGPWVGSGTVTIQGNTGTPANVIITANSSDGTILAKNGARIALSAFEVKSTGTQNLIRGASNAYIGFSNIRFGSGGNQQIRAEGGATVEATGNYSIVANATVHMQAVTSGIVLVQVKTVTVSASLTFTTFALGGSTGLVIANGNTYSTTTATGQRYSSDSNAVISTGGGGANYFPGSTAGATSNGGVYV